MHTASEQIVRQPTRAAADRLPTAFFRWLLLLALAALIACGGADDESPVPPASGARTLSIAPIAQQTEVWCWAASAEMVFRHYGLPALNANYQCGIVAAYFGGPCAVNCFTCVQAIGPMSQMHVLINNYGAVVSRVTPSRHLSSALLFSPLSFDQVAAQINGNRPIVAGISPGGYAYPNLSQHIAVSVGYDATGGGARLIVNDPFPYAAFPLQPNPYFIAGGTQTRPGQYSVSHAAFVSLMNWANTIHQIQ